MIFNLVLLDDVEFDDIEKESEGFYIARRPFLIEDNTIYLGQPGSHHSFYFPDTILENAYVPDAPFIVGALVPTPDGNYFVEFFNSPEEMGQEKIRPEVERTLRDNGIPIIPWPERPDFETIKSFQDWMEWKPRISSEPKIYFPGSREYQVEHSSITCDDPDCSICKWLEKKPRPDWLAPRPQEEWKQAAWEEEPKDIVGPKTKFKPGDRVYLVYKDSIVKDMGVGTVMRVATRPGRSQPVVLVKWDSYYQGATMVYAPHQLTLVQDETGQMKMAGWLDDDDNKDDDIFAPLDPTSRLDNFKVGDRVYLRRGSFIDRERGMGTVLKPPPGYPSNPDEWKVIRVRWDNIPVIGLCYPHELVRAFEPGGQMVLSAWDVSELKDEDGFIYHIGDEVIDADNNIGVIKEFWFDKSGRAYAVVRSLDNSRLQWEDLWPINSFSHLKGEQGLLFSQKHYLSSSLGFEDWLREWKNNQHAETYRIPWVVTQEPTGRLKVELGTQGQHHADIWDYNEMHLNSSAFGSYENGKVYVYKSEFDPAEITRLVEQEIARQGLPEVLSAQKLSGPPFTNYQWIPLTQFELSGWERVSPHEQTQWRRRADRHNQRARKFKAPGGITARELWALNKRFENQCAYCQKYLTWGTPDATLDHITPLALGGSGGIENLIPACRRCNHILNEWDHRNNPANKRNPNWTGVGRDSPSTYYVPEEFAGGEKIYDNQHKPQEAF